MLWLNRNCSYLSWVRLFLLVDEGLGCSGYGVSSRNRGSILRGAHKLNSSTLNDNVGCGWKIFRITDRIAIPQKPSFLPVQGMNLPATVDKFSGEKHPHSW